MYIFDDEDVIEMKEKISPVFHCIELNRMNDDDDVDEKYFFCTQTHFDLNG